MENLLEFCKNTVAFLIAMRIAVVIGLLIVFVKLIYTLLNTSEVKRFWQGRKKGIINHRNFIKHQDHSI